MYQKAQTTRPKYIPQYMTLDKRVDFLTKEMSAQCVDFVLRESMIIQSVSQIWASEIYLWWFDFRLEPIYTTASAVSKNNVIFKSGQK